LTPPATIPRRHRRYAVDVEATLGIGGIRVRARTRDISRTGICLISSEPVAAGTLAPLELVLAFGEDSYSEPLALSARIVWCTALGGSFQVGAMFDDVTDQQDSFLEMFLQYLGDSLSPDADPDEDGGGHDDDPFAH
jgi:hypothetical protein